MFVEAEHELETRRISERESRISDPLLIEPSHRILAAPSIGCRQCLSEVAKAEQRHFCQQPLGVLEMVRWGGGRNPEAACRLAQRKAPHAALDDNALRGGDQLPAQVAVMVGLPGRLLPGRFLGLAPAGFHLDTVQIES